MSRRALSPETVHEKTEIAVQTLANWRVQKVGPPFFKVGRLVRYYECDIDDWLESERLKSTA